MLVRIESISARRFCTSVSSVFESMISFVNSPLRSASTWVTLRVADSSEFSCASREAMVSDSRASPCREDRTSAGVPAKVCERVSKEFASWVVSIWSTVCDRSANAWTTS